MCVTILQDNLQQRNIPSRNEVENRYSIERNLQRFAQICISALKANTDVRRLERERGEKGKGVARRGERERRPREERELLFCAQFNDIATVAMADDQHYVSEFFRECHNNTLVHSRIALKFLF